MKKGLLILLCLPMIGFGQIFYFDEGDSATFYNLDILNNQFNYISTFPSSDGGYGSGSTFDPINNIFYITNGFGGMGGDDSTIIIGVDITNGSFISQSIVPHSIQTFEVWDNMCYYFEEQDSATFYNLDILNNQFNYISTFPSSDGDYGSESTYDPINNIFYITNGFGGMGGDDSTIIIGVDVTDGSFISQSIVPHSIQTFEVWDNMCYYFEEQDSATFYNLDILNNQFNYISTFPSSDGDYGSESTFDPINNIFYITNPFGNGGGGDDSTIVIGVDVTDGSFISQSIVPHTIQTFEFQFSLPTSINNTVYNKDRELLMLLNLLGQQTTEIKNTPLFYIYDDGTVEKRIVVE